MWFGKTAARIRSLAYRTWSSVIREGMGKSAKQKTTKAVPRPGARGRPRQRAEQRRAVDTRRAILDAALAEFAEKGFAAASIRAIADRTRLKHPLITYHFRSKDILWRATAEFAFGQIREAWDRLDESAAELSSLDRLRAEYASVFKYTVAFPEFHRFMRQECNTRNPRLKWAANNVVMPLIDRLVPQIAALQATGHLPEIKPILFHYMMISLTSTLSEFGPEMGVTGDVAADDPLVVQTYWRTVEAIVFGSSPSVSAVTPRRTAIRGGRS
jgi:AcrR family transcriptional regulator